MSINIHRQRDPLSDVDVHDCTEHRTVDDQRYVNRWRHKMGTVL